jgi:hypothetical protein
LGYETYWWDGAPYFYADDSYFRWAPAAGEYVTVEPPAGPPDAAGVTPKPSAGGATVITQLFAYPKVGQSEEQQAKDRRECEVWAKGASGYDPDKIAVPSDAELDDRGQFLRAEAACLSGRNYSVE